MSITPDTFASAPNVALPGSMGIPKVAPLLVDGIPIQPGGSAAGVSPSPAASALINPGGPLVPSPSRFAPGKAVSDPSRFWSCHPRLPGDNHQENLVISLARAKKINFISFDLPHFPHQFQIYWQDADGNWQPVCNVMGSPWITGITGSVPAIVNNAAALLAGLNPFHYGAGHWIHYDEMITPVTTTGLLFTATRQFCYPGNASSGAFPVDSGGHLSPYPLGVRNLDFGFRVRQRSDVPWTPRDPVTTTQRIPFTTVTDLLGNPVTLSMRENRASDLLNGLPWKCAPQAISTAVVNLYADARDFNGNPQVIDRFYIDPVTSGVRCNLYYSPDPPPASGDFQAIDTPLSFPLTDVGGSILPAEDSEGLVFSSSPGWLDLSSQGPGENSSSPWWAGFEIMPQFASGDPGSYVVADGGIFQLTYTGSQWVVSGAGGTLTTWDFPFVENQKLQFVIGFDGSNMFAWSPLGGAGFAPASGLPSTSVIRFGAFQVLDYSEPIWPGNYRLTAFVLKQELQSFGQDQIPPSFTSFAADAPDYVYPPDGPGDTTINALARYSLSFVLGDVATGLNPYGFVGGPGSSYAMCNWTPIQRDYTLAAGYLQFDPTLACVFKFEFTGLQPQTYEFFEATPQAVQVFPVSIPIVPPSPPGPHAAIDPGQVVTQNIAPTITFSDIPAPSAAPPPGAVLPTEAVYATDPAAALAMMRTGGSLYNFKQWQPQPAVPRFIQTGQHAYQTVDLQQTDRVAYFVSLSTLTMYRSDFTAQDDTEIYVDTFGDTAHINPATLVAGGLLPSPWSWQPGTLFTPTGLAGGDNGFAQISSVVFNSRHPVRGVQLATSQSDAVQLLTDPDFTDPQIEFWEAVGDAAALEIASTINAQLGSMVQVTRVPSASSWDQLGSDFATWTAITSFSPTWNTIQGETQASAYGGMAYSGAPVATTKAGRVYAAARVFSPVPLTEPLSLQLLDGLTGAVVAEAEQPVGGGSVTEWYVGYTIGSDGAPSDFTWNQVQGNYPTWALAEGVIWSTIDTFIAPLGTTLSAQLVQRGLTTDTWYVDNISVFEDSIVWEFSNDGGASWWAAYEIKNNPSGVLVFPPPKAGNGTQLMWRLSGYRPGLHVSGLAIRPWYTTHPLGVPPRIGNAGQGPNLSPNDHYSSISADPRWQAWDLPVPQDWFFLYRQLLLAAGQYVTSPVPPLPPADVVLGDAIIFNEIPVPPAPPASPFTFTDIYSDEYTSYYGVPDGSDIYTDTYNDNYPAE